VSENLEMKNIDYLIYGGTGFIGNKLHVGLSEKYSVKTLGRSLKNDFQINDTNLIEKLRSYQFKTIIHCSGITHNHTHANLINEKLVSKDIKITERLLGILDNIHWDSIIYLISIAIYGLSTGVNINLGQEIKINNGYSFARYTSENILFNFNNNKSVTVIRLPLVFSTEAKGNLDLLSILFKMPIVFLPRNGGFPPFL
jgi:nucleoside-diphosphate-sugar epimerase